MECNVIKTYSFVSFDLIYYYDSLGNRPKFELCEIFLYLYILGFVLQLSEWTFLPLMYDGDEY